MDKMKKDNNKYKDVTFKINQFYDRLSIMYEKYTDNKINDIENLYNWIFNIIVRNHFNFFASTDNVNND